MFIERNKIYVSKELRDYIIPLNEEEFGQLEKNILKEGCRDPLVVWQKDNGQLILIDGHNRFKICQKHNIDFKIKKIDFQGLEEAKIWMIENQMGRRNLNPDQLSFYRGLRYLALKKERGGYSNVKLKGKVERSTSEKLSEKFNVSESTVKRDAKFAQGLNIINRSNPRLKVKILAGEVKVKKSDIQILVNAKNHDKLVVKNEADLYNKAKLIRNDVMDDMEKRINNISAEKVEKAQKILADSEPPFLTKDDRLRKIKGMVISAINRAINKKDARAIKELRKLIDELSEVIFY